MAVSQKQIEPGALLRFTSGDHKGEEVVVLVRKQRLVRYRTVGQNAAHSKSSDSTIERLAQHTVLVRPAKSRRSLSEHQERLKELGIDRRTLQLAIGYWTVAGVSEALAESGTFSPDVIRQLASAWAITTPGRAVRRREAPEKFTFGLVPTDAWGQPLALDADLSALLPELDEQQQATPKAPKAPRKLNVRPLASAAPSENGSIDHLITQVSSRVMLARTRMERLHSEYEAAAAEVDNLEAAEEALRKTNKV